MYDSVTIVAAVPELRDRFFSSSVQFEYDCGTASHVIYGHSASWHGVVQPRDLCQLLEDVSLSAISINPKPYPLVIFTDPGVDLDDELVLISLRSLVERQLVRPIGVVCNLHPSLVRK